MAELTVRLRHILFEDLWVLATSSVCVCVCVCVCERERERQTAEKKGARGERGRKEEYLSIVGRDTQFFRVVNSWVVAIISVC